MTPGANSHPKAEEPNPETVTRPSLCFSKPDNCLYLPKTEFQRMEGGMISQRFCPETLGCPPSNFKFNKVWKIMDDCTRSVRQELNFKPLSRMGEGTLLRQVRGPAGGVW